MVKNLPAMQETWVRSLGLEDPLEEGKSTHSSSLAWRIPGTGEPGGLPSMGAGKEGPQLARTGASQGFPRAAAPVGVFSRVKLKDSCSLGEKL